ncbi:MAG TPA: dihydroorotate dehydrogenase [Firmicutes bacterium]|nr:dihydroorotate dehydrogenase [Bacillota bacterium]
MSVDMSVELAGLKLKNPVMPASGTFGFGEEYAHYFDLNKLGAIVVKSVTLKPTPGNLPPRIAETASGMLNSIGWQNPGLEVFLKEKLPFLRRFETPVIVNLAGFTVEEYAELAGRLDGVPGIHALEANISCPNVHEGGIAFGSDPQLAAEVTRGIKKQTSLPLIVKLSPNVTDIKLIAAAVEEAGADIISLVNAYSAVVIDLDNRRPLLGNIVGGLTGPAIKPAALYQLWQVAKTVKIPIIGMGGICTARDALEFMLAGASAVAVGAATFRDPLAMLKIIDGIEAYLAEQGIERVTDFIGTLKTDETE